MQGVQTALNSESWTEAQEAGVSLPSFAAIPHSRSHIHVVPDVTAGRSGRQPHWLIKINRSLRTLLIALCGLAILGYGLDVAASHDVSKTQEQARRLSEQNTELSAQLLRAISFQGIQSNVVGKAGLRVPEHVIIVKEVEPSPVKPFKPRKHYLPLMSGY